MLFGRERNGCYRSGCSSLVWGEFVHLISRGLNRTLDMRDDFLRLVKINQFFPFRVFMKDSQLRVVPIRNDPSELMKPMELRIGLIGGTLRAATLWRFRR